MSQRGAVELCSQWTGVFYVRYWYATIDKNGRFRGERKHKSNGKSSKQQSSDSNAEDSEYGGPAGIYKKGHIWEGIRVGVVKTMKTVKVQGFLSLVKLKGEITPPDVPQNGFSEKK